MRVEVPLIVDVESGMNDYLDRDGSRTPIQRRITNDQRITSSTTTTAPTWTRGTGRRSSRPASATSTF